MARPIKNIISLVLILVLLAIPGMEAADTLQLDDSFVQYDLLPYAELFIDETGALEMMIFLEEKLFLLPMLTQSIIAPIRKLLASFHDYFSCFPV